MTEPREPLAVVAGHGREDAGHALGAANTVRAAGTRPPPSLRNVTDGSRSSISDGEVPVLGRVEEGLDDLALLLGAGGVAGAPRLDRGARPRRELAGGRRGAPDDARHLLERVAEHVVQAETRCARRERATRAR